MANIQVNETFRRMRSASAAAGLALSLTAAACGGNAPTDPANDADETAGEPRVGSIEQLAQFDAIGSYNLDFNNKKQKVSAAIGLPWTSDGTTWASCGVTFVSKHFAITAAHCVPQDKVPITPAVWIVSASARSSGYGGHFGALGQNSPWVLVGIASGRGPRLQRNSGRKACLIPVHGVVCSARWA